MRRAVVSIFIDENLYDAKSTGVVNFKPEATQIYYNLKDNIIKNHKTYANNIGADYILFEKDETWNKFLHNFRQKYPRIAMYNYINYYKFFIAELLTDSYDEVLYVDFDAFFNTNDNFFDVYDVKNFCVQVWYMPTFKNNPRALNIGIPKLRLMKSWYIQKLLNEIFDYNNDSFELFMANTGVHGYSKNVIEQLNFFDIFDKSIEYIQSQHDDCAEDNEVFFVAAAIINKVPLTFIDHSWNKGTKDKPFNGKICHFTQKNKISEFFDL